MGDPPIKENGCQLTGLILTHVTGTIYWMRTNLPLTMCRSMPIQMTQRSSNLQVAWLTMPYPVETAPCTDRSLGGRRRPTRTLGTQTGNSSCTGTLPRQYPHLLRRRSRRYCRRCHLAGSVGRYDLPGGDGAQLMDSIRKKIYTLPDDTTLFPGHGPTTTVGHEKTSNPFVRDEPTAAK